MPEQVAVALRPPKSVAAVPDISEVMPMDAMTMNTAAPADDERRGKQKHRHDHRQDQRRSRTASRRAARGGIETACRKSMPPENPPTMPKMQSNQPQCCAKNSAPGCFTSSAKMEYHCVMLLRKMPEVRSTQRNQQHQRAGENFFSRSSTENSTCIWPDDASWVSKCGKPASSGVSLISHKSSSSPENQNGGGNEKHRPGGIHGLTPAGREKSFAANRAGAIGLGQVNDCAAPVEGEINADGNERPENRAEDAALAHVEPIGLDLDDGHRAVALEIHVHRIEQRISDDQVDLQMLGDDEPGQHAQRDVGQRRADGGNDDAAFCRRFLSTSGPLTRNDSA